MKSILKRKNKKGFTLMEMLIVIGIIAILVAIAIPTFTGAQKKAQYAADVANTRAWYAEKIIKGMTETFEPTINESDIKNEMEKAGMKLQLAGATVTASGSNVTDYKVVYNSGVADKDAFKSLAFGGDGKVPTKTSNVPGGPN